MELLSHSEKETQNIAKDFLDIILADAKHPLIVELVGELGAGKTTFMKGVGEYFGIKEVIISPTFLIQRNYDIKKNGPFKRLIHLDVYRFEDESELDSIDWKKYSNDKDNIIFIEWPSKMKSRLPDDSIKIEFFNEGETIRRIKYEI